MSPPHDIDTFIRQLDEASVRFYKVGVFDVDGVLRGKYLDREKFVSALRKGFGFCDVVLGWDTSDQMYDNASISGWHTGYRDAPVRLDRSTYRFLPSEPHTVLVLGNFADKYSEVCPRSLLQRVVERARSLGFIPKGSAEYEFFLFQETPESAREKGYRNLKPFTPGMFGYSVLRSSVHHGLYQELLDTMNAMDCSLEGLHTETGPGVLEAAIRFDVLDRAADKAALFKTFAKVLAQKRGLMATFMAKWSNDYPGQSGHLHLSLTSADTGENCFHESGAEADMSAVMRHFVAGQVRLLPEVLPMVCSTVNAYRRMVPGFWAPTASSWGVENRTTAIRVIASGKESQRSEYRIGPADANPYLAMAAALATGLYGIEHKLDLPPAVVGNAYESPQNTLALPRTLREATQRFHDSTIARELFGDAFVDHFTATREWEDRMCQKHISDWDLARYFEII